MESNISIEDGSKSKVDMEMEMNIDLNNNQYPVQADPVTSSSGSSPQAPPLLDSWTRISMIGPQVKGRARRTCSGDSAEDAAVKRIKGGDVDGDRVRDGRETFGQRKSKGYSKAAHQTSRVSSSASSASKPKPTPQLDILKIINTFENLGEDQTGLNFVDFFSAGISVSLDFNFNLEEELAKTVETGDYDWIQDAVGIDMKNRVIKRKSHLLNQKW